MPIRLLPVLLLLCVPCNAAATTFLVDSTGDGTAGTNCPGLSNCTLRAALLAANASPGADFIRFALPRDSTIVLGSALPAITAPVVLDARPQPEYIGRPWVYLDGRALAGASGLTLADGSDTSQVLGLGLYGFTWAITIQVGADRVLVDGCLFGRAADNQLHGNGVGIIAFSNGNLLGKRRLEGEGFAGVGNVVVASLADGLFLAGDGNQVYGNVIGGFGPSEGNGTGISLAGSNDTIVGGVESGSSGGNHVGFSTGAAISVAGERNVVQANLVGVGSAGQSRGNGGPGIQVRGPANLIGGAGAGDGNTIAFNEAGVLVGASGAAVSTQVLGNTIRDNRGGGLRILAGTGNLVDGNDIAGNGTAAIGDGVRIDSSGNTVSNNRIGVESGNSGEGVFVNGFTSGNVLGPGNVVGNNLNGFKVQGANTQVIANTVGGAGIGNRGQGIYMVSGSEGSLVQGNSVDGSGGSGLRINAGSVTAVGNLIGLSAPNGGEGVHVAAGADGNRIGPDNVIVASGNNGVLVQGAATELVGNLIGLDAAGAPLANDGHGVLLTESATAAQVTDNHIGGNVGHGVQVEAAAARLCGNHIGGSGHGNAGSGVSVAANAVRVGSSDAADACARNFITFNEDDGIVVRGNEDTRVDGNSIHHNGIAGVALIGDSAYSLVRQNRIWLNGSTGIHLGSDAGPGNRISANQMFDNGVPGVDLGGDGPTANDAGDPDEGPNRLQNSPVIHFAAPLGGTELEIGFSVDSSMGNADWPLRVEIFVGRAGNSEATADLLEGAQLVETSLYEAHGVHTVVATMPNADPGLLTATATDAEGNTSEFSPGFPYSLERPAQLFGDGFED